MSLSNLIGCAVLLVIGIGLSISEYACFLDTFPLRVYVFAQATNSLDCDCLLLSFQAVNSSLDQFYCSLSPGLVMRLKPQARRFILRARSGVVVHTPHPFATPLSF